MGESPEDAQSLKGESEEIGDYCRPNQTTAASYRATVLSSVASLVCNGHLGRHRLHRPPMYLALVWPI